MQARCKCGNGVFIVVVETGKYASTDPKFVTLRYECTLCDHKTFFEMNCDDAAAFCAGLNDTYGTDDEE